MKHKKIMITIGILCLGLAVLYFSIYTTRGSKLVADKMISRLVDHGSLDYEGLSGSLGEGMTFQDLEIHDIRNLPKGTVLRIKRLYFNLASMNLNEIEIEIENARVMLPDSEPIIVSGSLKNQELNINIYSNGFGVNDVAAYVPDFKGLIPISGDLTEIDLYLTGNFLEPKVKGSFTVEEFIYKGFKLTDSPIDVDVSLKEIRRDVQLFGNVAVSGGTLQAKKSAIKQISGRISFSGEWNQPSFNLSGKSKVEKTKISVNLKGTLDSPELNLSSEPSYSKEKLMVMLATGKSWKSVEDAFDTGTLSSDLTKDFIDYFFFAGKTNKFVEKFGLHDVVVKYDKNGKGIEAKKGVTDNLDVGYGIEQQSGDDQATVTKQKMLGEFQVTEEVSVGVEREIRKSQNLDDLDPKPDNVNDDKVYLKYKKSF